MWLTLGGESETVVCDTWKFLGRLPVTVFKSLNHWQSYFLLSFKESKEPIQFKLSYVDLLNCQRIQKGCTDRSFTLGTLVSLGRLTVTVFKLLNDRQSEFREPSEPIMYELSFNM